MGALEARVLDVLWDDGGWLTPGEVNEALADARPLAYTTVMTILVRLHEKGVVERERRGRTWTYHPFESREQTTATRMQALLDGSAERSVALARFIDGMTAKERAELRRILGTRRRS
jgi:predicted transcriptional regulator